MKQPIRKSTLSLVLLSGALGIIALQPAFSDENEGGDQPRYERHERHDRRERRFEFALGLCVGQALAQQGVTVPAPQPGQPPQWDATTKAAVQAAIAQCRAQPSPSPSASATPEPTGTVEPASPPSPSAS